MGKKDRKRGGQPQTPDPGGRGTLSARGWKIVALGIGLAAVGYVLLSFTDPAGRNWASRLSPFVIVGGYATIGFGILAPAAPKPSMEKRLPESNPSRPV
jgi:hypothetical protein